MEVSPFFAAYAVLRDELSNVLQICNFTHNAWTCCLASLTFSEIIRSRHTSLASFVLENNNNNTNPQNLEHCLQIQLYYVDCRVCNYSSFAACRTRPILISPTLMQVYLGGLTNALTPLAASNCMIHVINAPTQFLDVLWLPFRRRHAELRASLAQSSGQVSAVFGHADVVQPQPVEGLAQSRSLLRQCIVCFQFCHLSNVSLHQFELHKLVPAFPRNETSRDVHVVRTELWLTNDSAVILRCIQVMFMHICMRWQRC